jgi:uncharacterized protein (TIGR02271 family)
MLADQRTAELRRGAVVEAAAGGRGRLKHVIVHPHTREVTDLVVSFEGADRLVPAAAIVSGAAGRIVLRGDWAEYRSSGPFRRRVYHRANLGGVRPEAQQHVAHGGLPLLAASRGAVRVGLSPSPPSSGGEAEPALTPAGPYRIQLREERPRLEWNTEYGALLSVSRRTVERIETVEVPIREERVTLRRVRGGDMRVMVDGRELSEGEAIEITVATEEVRLSKQRVGLVDLLIGKGTLRREEQIPITLRRESLTVDDPAQLAVQRVIPSSDGSNGHHNGNGRNVPAPAATERPRSVQPGVEGAASSAQRNGKQENA